MSEENALATKAGVQAVKTEVQSLRSEFKTDIEALETRAVERFLEAVHDTETRVLNTFYAFAQTNDKRMTVLEDTDSKIVPLLGAIESRVLEIEKRLNIPPAA